MHYKVLIGKTLQSIENIDDEELIFSTVDGQKYKMYHEQECTETVTIEDIEGDLNDLIGSPILQAEESTNDEDENVYDESFKWTFYKLATVKGYVTIRWFGSSNGHYCESVDFEQIQ